MAKVEIAAGKPTKKEDELGGRVGEKQSGKSLGDAQWRW